MPDSFQLALRVVLQDLQLWDLLHRECRLARVLVGDKCYAGLELWAAYHFEAHNLAKSCKGSSDTQVARVVTDRLWQASHVQVVLS